MIRHTPEFDQRIADWLEADPTDAPVDVLSTVVAALPSIPQARRGLLAPWRFTRMTNFTRAAAGVAIVAIVGVGILAFNSRGSVGTQTPAPPSASPAPTLHPTSVPTAEATPEPSFVAPGITGWKTYTSSVYGYTISYPEDWSVAARATQKWQLGDSEEAPSWDIFLNPDTVDGDGIVFQALQFPGPAGADLGSWDGLRAALTEMCAKPAEFFAETPCPSEGVTRMCLGSSGCQPVAFVHDNDLPRALFGDPETGIFTYILVGRVDDFPAAARYGGTVTLLKSILSQLGVREPRPEETPN